MRLVLILSPLAALVGCIPGGGDCGEAECATICAQAAGSVAQAATPSPTPEPAAPSGPALSDFEQQLVGPVLEQVRAGVQAWDDQSVGICAGSGRDCGEFLGTEASDLPAGEYMVRGAFRVPQVGEPGTWRVRFETECTVTRETASGESSTTTNYSREYDVRYAGEERGSRLSPLYTFRSPNPHGRQTCEWKIIGLHTDNPTEWTGSWTVPGA